MRVRILLALSLLCSGAVFAAAPVRLTAPSSGATLRGDHFATIAWSADRLIDAEEWEAFLSVDGGRYYSVRITPHLDLNIHSFDFLVPNIASEDVRLLLRVGDEHIETIIEFPQRFSIRASPSPVVGRRLSMEPGPESARPGDAPVVEWASGGRTGGNVEFAQSRPRGRSIGPRIRETRGSSTCAVTRHDANVVALATDSSVSIAPSAPQAAIRLHVALRKVLRLISRLNV